MKIKIRENLSAIKNEQSTEHWAQKAELSQNKKKTKQKK
jgi:hypothetical protein